MVTVVALFVENRDLMKWGEIDTLTGGGAP